MMKRLLTIFLMCMSAMIASAQLEVKSFDMDVFDPAVTQFEQKDHNCSTCALIIVKVPLSNVKFEGKVVNTVKRDGAYWVYVERGAHELEIIPSEKDKLNPIEVDFTKQYEDGLQLATYKLIIEPKRLEAPKSSFTLSAGFNVMNIMGPKVSAGFMYNGFTIEAGAVYGLGKSKDVYIYNKGGDLQDAYNYNALRAFLCLGYDVWAADVFALTPQLGAAFTSVKGSRLSEVNTSNKVLDGATAISATLGLRLMFAPSGKTKPLRLFLTPEYDLAVSKDKNFEELSNYDSKIKSWADGLNLSLGLLFYF